MKKIAFLLIVLPMLLADNGEAQNGRRRPVRNLSLHYLGIDKSPEGLELYRQEAKKFHRRAKGMGLEKVQATVTMQDPVTVDQALEILETYGLKPRFLYAFGDKNGQTVTYGYSFTSTHRERATAMARRNAMDRDFMGIVSIITAVPVAQLPALQNDSRIFLVDLVADENFTYNQGNGQYMHHLAWDLHENKKKALKGR
jgi:hypothetical protein